MTIQARAKLRAWMQRPKGSLGWILAIVVLLLATSVYRGLSPAWRLIMHDPAVLLAILALTVALGWAVQRGVRRTVGKAIFNGQETGWQDRLAFLRSVARESNLLLVMLVCLALLGTGTLGLAGRSVAQIAANCEANLQAQVDTPEHEKLNALVGRPVCTCLAQRFMTRNGILRMALFETPLQGVTGLKALTPDDEQHCLEQFDLLPEEPHARTP